MDYAAIYLSNYRRRAEGRLTGAERPLSMKQLAHLASR